MIFMRNAPRLVIALAAAGAILLSACSNSEPDGNRADGPGPEFDRLIADARFEMDEGNLAEAGRLYDEALAINRSDATLWVDIARLRFRGGEHSGALEAVDLALELDPQLASALLMRAQLVRDAFGFNAALKWFESALAIHPENVDLLAEYAGTLGDVGRNRDMLAMVRRLAEVDPREPRVHFLQAVLAARAGDPVLASSLLKRSGMREKGVPSAIMLDALVDLQQGNFDTAATSLEQLLDRQPANVRVMELLARSLWLNGRDRELVDRFETRAMAVDGSPYLAMLVGRSLERIGKRSEAIRFISKAREGRTGDLVVLPATGGNPRGLPDVTFQVRQTINASGNSRGYANDLLRRFPQSSDIKVLAGDAALERDSVTEALELYSAAASVRRPWPLTKKIIHAYRRSGDNDSADTLLVRHLWAEPRNTEALSMFAARAAADEDWLRVAVLLDNAIELGAGNDPELLALRIMAANRLEEDGLANELRATLAQLRPQSFLRQ